MERLGCGAIPQLTDLEEDVDCGVPYAGQLPGRVAAPLGHPGIAPRIGGASANTRVAELTPPVTGAPPGLEVTPEVERLKAYPTDSKERERNKRQAMREAGQEIKVKKKSVIEDHFDDCGEDLSSLVGLADCATSEEESDTAHDEDMRL